MPESKKLEEPLREISQHDLRRQDVVYFLGLMASRSLESFGQVTFMMGSDNKVAMANPVHVYLDANAIIEGDNQKLPPFQWIRPVLGQGKPQYVAWKNGELWEIVFEEPYEPQS